MKRLLLLMLLLAGCKAGAGESFELSWEPSPGPLRHFAPYMVEWRRVGTINWIRHGYTSDTKYVIEQSIPGTYEVTVKSISDKGAVSLIGEVATFTVIGTGRRVRTIVEETRDDGTTWTVISETEQVVPK